MTRLQAHLHAIETARRMTLGLLEGLAPPDWLHQPVPGGQHVLWIVGHLAIADDCGLVSLGKQRRLTHLDVPFDSKKPIMPDSAGYPSIEETKRAFDSAHEAFIARLQQIEDADLDRATSGPIARFAPNLDTLLTSHVWHEGFHAGQLALIRRSLGLPVRWG